ncbi:uncharacterized protein [Littorina saxatilis]|uniref:uncharacterized protein isoform X2 n=1 Tax=Littorina saxatilis TaxID=31220 RepID=UPI0038B4409A
MSGVYSVCVCLVLLNLSLYRSVSGQWCAPKLFETKKWSLRIQYTDQGPDIWERTSTQSIDMIGQRLASHETGTRNGFDYSLFNLYYYPAGTLFTVLDGVCTASPIKGNISDLCFNWQDRHVIDMFTKEVIGVGDNRAPIMGTIKYNGGIGSLYAFSMAGFIPLFDGTTGTFDGVPTYSVGSYTNVTQGIKDPTIFTPPVECIQSKIPAASPASVFDL